MKLNPEDLAVTSFEVSDSAVLRPSPTTISYDPTPMTYCYWCPPRTFDCPIFTDPGTSPVLG